MHAPTLAERLAGGVWGHLVGDALGVPYEFSPPSEISTVEWGHSGQYGQPAGTWSDDGGLMLALLDSLLTVGFDIEDQGRRSLAWMDGPDYKPGERFDIGITTRNALTAFRSGVPAAQAGGAHEGDNGNGSLMRILPVAMVGRDLSPEVLAQQAMAASGLTHRHPRAELVCGLYALIAQRLLQGEDNIDAALSSAASTLARDAPDHQQELGLIMAYDRRSGSGYAVDTFWSALEALSSASDYRDAVSRAVRFGNDTDTTACVTGGLAGIVWGIGSIPSEWLEGMRGAEIVAPLISRLLALATDE